MKKRHTVSSVNSFQATTDIKLITIKSARFIQRTSIDTNMHQLSQLLRKHKSVEFLKVFMLTTFSATEIVQELVKKQFEKFHQRNKNLSTKNEVFDFSIFWKARQKLQNFERTNVSSPYAKSASVI